MGSAIITPPWDLRYGVRPEEDELRIRNPGNAAEEEEEAIVGCFEDGENSGCDVVFVKLSSHPNGCWFGDGVLPSFFHLKFQKCGDYVEDKTLTNI